MVIVVPNGDNGVPPDETRKPEWYDGNKRYWNRRNISSFTQSTFRI